MAKNATRDIKEKWEPTEGVNRGAFVRMPEETWEAIARYAPDIAPPEAIRQLVALGLKSSRLTRGS